MEQHSESAEAAEAYVEALASQGVEYLFLNPGTDTFPIQEAISKLRALGRPTPRTVLCLFEVVALAAAHGYYAATGRTPAVLVHVDVGTQNLGGMLHNAQRARVPVLISAGRSPYTTDAGRRGSRDTYIHWLQEQLDQHGIVRNYVKWDYEVRRSDQIGEAVARAFQIAASDPMGPVYLTLPRENLMDASADVPIYPRSRMPPVKLGAGDPDALRDVARRLLSSKRPLVLTATTGRTANGFRGLLRLAELLALPIIEWRDRANFPSDHPLHQGYSPIELLPSADLVLILDHDVPYLPSQVAPAPDATIIQIDVDPVKERIPLWSFPQHLPIRANTGRALDVIADEVKRLLGDDDRQRIVARHDELRLAHERRRARWEAEALALAVHHPIHPAWLARCLGELYREAPDCLFVGEAVTSNPFIWQNVDVHQTGTWFGSEGSALGWGLGAALGVKLAHPDRPVLALVGDGCFVFGAPLAALWATQVQSAPILVVIFDNACYNATKTPLIASYPEGYSVRGDSFVGVDLVPTPRYDRLAPVVGAYGERVEDPAEVLPALRRGLERVRGGQSVILDVQIGRP
jgi:acetolactate synthase-1/2/3 large subunit